MHYKNSIVTALALVFMQLSAKTYSYGPIDAATPLSYEGKQEIYAEAEKSPCRNNQEAKDPSCSICKTECVYGPSSDAGVEEKEPVNFNDYAFEAEVFAMCAKAYSYRNDEQRHTCGELADNIRLMIQLGQKQHVETKVIVDNIGKLTEEQRELSLHTLIRRAATVAKSELKNDRINTYQERHNGSREDVMLAYIEILYKNMAGNDSDTYFKMKSILDK